MTKQIVVIGAGKTGRGFIGRFLAERDLPFVLADRDEALVSRLQKQDGYEIRFYGGKRPPVQAKPQAVLQMDSPACTQALQEAEIVFVSVGYGSLEALGRSLNGRLSERARVFVAENGEAPAERLKQGYHGGAQIGSAVVFCTTNETEDGNLISETIDAIPYDARALPGNFLTFDFLQPVQDFDALMRRKLLTYNAANAIITYLGSRMGYTYLSQAAVDPKLQALLHRHFAAIGRALCAEYGYTAEDQAAFAGDAMRKFTNADILDPLTRNGRRPLLKLVPSERLVGSLRLLEKYGEDTEPIEQTIAYALAFDADADWRAYVAQTGVERILTQTCGIAPDEPAFDRILKLYRTLV